MFHVSNKLCAPNTFYDPERGKSKHMYRFSSFHMGLGPFLCRH
jgi:hypothetical protein